MTESPPPSTQSGPHPATIYKVLPRPEWEAAVAAGAYAGSADDRRDGYIHLSTATQLAGTLAKYFRDLPDLVLVAFDAASLGSELRWETSRGGALFPHLYAPLPAGQSLWQKPLPLGADGVPILPELTQIADPAETMRR